MHNYIMDNSYTQNTNIQTKKQSKNINYQQIMIQGQKDRKQHDIQRIGSNRFKSQNQNSVNSNIVRRPPLNPIVIQKDSQINKRSSNIQKQPNSQVQLNNSQQLQENKLPAKLTRCPECNSLLRVSYSCTGFTTAWSMFLLIGLTCWVPCVVDACKKSQARCVTCDKIVQVYEPSCC